MKRLSKVVIFAVILALMVCFQVGCWWQTGGRTDYSPKKDSTISKDKTEQNNTGKDGLTFSKGTTAQDILNMAKSGEIHSFTFKQEGGLDVSDRGGVLINKCVVSADKIQSLLVEYIDEQDWFKWLSIMDFKKELTYALKISTNPQDSVSMTKEKFSEFGREILSITEEANSGIFELINKPKKDGYTFELTDNGFKFYGYSNYSSDLITQTFYDINCTEIDLPEEFQNYEEKAHWLKYKDENGVEYEYISAAYEVSSYSGNKKQVEIMNNIDGVSVTEIGWSAFENCSNLTKITIPISVTEIDWYAFSGCSNLTSIVYQGTKEQWKAISKGRDWDKDTGDYTVYCTDGEIKK